MWYDGLNNPASVFLFHCKVPHFLSNQSQQIKGLNRIDKKWRWNQGLINHFCAMDLIVDGALSLAVELVLVAVVSELGLLTVLLQLPAVLVTLLHCLFKAEALKKAQLSVNSCITRLKIKYLAPVANFRDFISIVRKTPRSTTASISARPKPALKISRVERMIPKQEKNNR